MRLTEQTSHLPLWETASTATSKPEESTQTMILVSVPEALEGPLRAAARDEDVSPDLRKAISQYLPSVDEQESTAAASSGDSEENGAAKQSGTLSLPPATLAKALPHIRRLMPREEGEAAASALELLRGGRLQFPDKRVAGASAKVGEEKREFEDRRHRLLLLREQKEYARMTSNIQRAPRETVRDIQESFKFQAGMGANMVVAVVTAFIISYWASKFLVGDNTAHRMVIGLVGAVFMMLIELMVFVVRSLKADEVLATARQHAEESHTDVGVHRLAPRPEPMAGRGVLEQSSSDERGDYELVSTGLAEDTDGASEPTIGIASKQ